MEEKKAFPTGITRRVRLVQRAQINNKGDDHCIPEYDSRVRIHWSIERRTSKYEIFSQSQSIVSPVPLPNSFYLPFVWWRHKLRKIETVIKVCQHTSSTDISSNTYRPDNTWSLWNTPELFARYTVKRYTLWFRSHKEVVRIIRCWPGASHRANTSLGSFLPSDTLSGLLQWKFEPLLL